MGFNQHKLGDHLPCLMGPIFHSSEASGFEEKDFNIFLCNSMVQTQKTLRRICIGPWGHYLNKLGLGPQRQGCIQNYKFPSLAVLENKIFKCILLTDPGPLG